MSGWEDLDHEIDKITSDLHKIADATEDFIKDKKNGKSTNDRRVKEVNKLIAQLRIRMNSLELEIREAQSYVQNVKWLIGSLIDRINIDFNLQLNESILLLSFFKLQINFK